VAFYTQSTFAVILGRRQKAEKKERMKERKKKQKKKKKQSDRKLLEQDVNVTYHIV